MRKLQLMIIMLLIGIPTVFADVKLLDVSADGTACIFKVNNKITVVEERDTKVVDGYRIYVQEAYPLHSQAKDSDKCKALISFSGKGLTTVSEGDAVNKNERNSSIANTTTNETNDDQGAANNISLVQTMTKKEAALHKPIAQAPTYWQRLWSFWKRLFT